MEKKYELILVKPNGETEVIHRNLTEEQATEEDTQEVLK